MAVQRAAPPRSLRPPRSPRTHPAKREPAAPSPKPAPAPASGAQVKSVHGLAVGGEVAEGLGKASKIAGRFAPGVGAVLNLANAAIDWRQAREGGHPGSYVAAVGGDLISAAGA